MAFAWMRRIVVCGWLLVMLGCASTTVKKNPGDHDKGFRYYLPKPYLLVQADKESTDLGALRITLDYLPDFSEQYSVRIRSGIGTNKTTLALDKGWMLTSIDVDVDSQVDEFINSIAGLLGTTPNLLRRPGAAGSAPTPPRTEAVSVVGHNVPIGYYEAVIARGPDGLKRHYAWRYVGFAPFSACPLDMSGSQCVKCDEADLFALVPIGNKLYFRSLRDLANPETIPALSEMPSEAKSSESKKSDPAQKKSEAPKPSKEGEPPLPDVIDQNR